MWAIPDEAKVRLLIKRGARVNAVSATDMYYAFGSDARQRLP